MPDPKKPDPKPPSPSKPRTPPSPDIQALARIDRILSGLPPEVAERTMAFLLSKYSGPTISSSPPEKSNVV